jgi:hypothetical protein
VVFNPCPVRTGKTSEAAIGAHQLTLQAATPQAPSQPIVRKQKSLIMGKQPDVLWQRDFGLRPQHVPQDEVNRRVTLTRCPQALQPNIALDRDSVAANPKGRAIRQREAF